MTVKLVYEHREIREKMIKAMAEAQYKALVRHRIKPRLNNVDLFRFGEFLKDVRVGQGVAIFRFVVDNWDKFGDFMRNECLWFDFCSKVPSPKIIQMNPVRCEEFYDQYVGKPGYKTVTVQELAPTTELIPGAI